jgi:hypothetical protein
MCVKCVYYQEKRNTYFHGFLASRGLMKIFLI